MTQDHIINLAAGGPDRVGNMQWLCRPCHTAKTAQEIQAGRDRAKAQRGSLSRRYRDHEPHPATQPNNSAVSLITKDRTK